jgi:hypothetical protein
VLSFTYIHDIWRKEFVCCFIFHYLHCAFLIGQMKLSANTFFQVDHSQPNN